MSKNEDVYKLLIEMGEDIGFLKSHAELILAEAKKTNGRVTKLEERATTSETANQISWAKVGWVASVGLFLLIAVFNVFIDWIKTKLIN